MNSIVPANHDPGITLCQAALIAGFGLLIMVFAAPIAELYAYPRLVVPGNIEETVQNILDHEGLFLAGVFCYLITFICDVLVAWALYVLLMPANRSVSLLTAWFRLVYTVIALFGLLRLVTVFRLLNTPDSVGNRWVGLSGLSLESIPFPRRRSRIPHDHVLRGSDLHALAFDQRLEAPGTDSACLSIAR